MNRKVAVLLFLLILSAVAAAVLVKPRKSTNDDHAPAATQTESRPEQTSLVETHEEDEPKHFPKKPDLRQNYCAKPYATTCGTSWPSLDPTGIVRPDVTGEVRALRFMRNLIRENPSWTSEQVQEELAKVIYTDVRRKRAEDGFRWVTAAMQKFIESQPDAIFSPEEKKALLGRISQITLELPPPASVYSDAVDLITKNTVYYERTPKNVLRLRMGGAYLLNTTSWFNVIYTLSHEIAHSIDPCEARHAGILPRAYSKLVSCFVSAGWVARSRSECGPNEQVSEVFADWVAAELIGRAIADTSKGYTPKDRAQAAINAARDLCEQPTGDSLNLRTHQEPEVRIGSVIGKSPSVRHALGCASVSPKYCRFEAIGSQAIRTRKEASK